MKKIIPAVATAAVLLLASGPAWADRIGGNWCHQDGRNMTIDGPKIRTPGGTNMTGEYDRHGFRYVAPAGELDAGAAIEMAQLDDETINVQVGKDTAAQVWIRCTLKMS